MNKDQDGQSFKQISRQTIKKSPWSPPELWTCSLQQGGAGLREIIQQGVSSPGSPRQSLTSSDHEVRSYSRGWAYLVVPATYSPPLITRWKILKIRGWSFFANMYFKLFLHLFYGIWYLTFYKLQFSTQSSWSWPMPVFGNSLRRCTPSIPPKFTRC